MKNFFSDLPKAVVVMALFISGLIVIFLNNAFGYPDGVNYGILLLLLVPVAIIPSLDYWMVDDTTESKKFLVTFGVLLFSFFLYHLDVRNYLDFFPSNTSHHWLKVCIHFILCMFIIVFVNFFANIKEIDEKQRKLAEKIETRKK